MPPPTSAAAINPVLMLLIIMTSLCLASLADIAVSLVLISSYSALSARVRAPVAIEATSRAKDTAPTTSAGVFSVHESSVGTARGATAAVWATAIGEATAGAIG